MDGNALAPRGGDEGGDDGDRDEQPDATFQLDLGTPDPGRDPDYVLIPRACTAANTAPGTRSAPLPPRHEPRHARAVGAPFIAKLRLEHLLLDRGGHPERHPVEGGGADAPPAGPGRQGE